MTWSGVIVSPLIVQIVLVDRLDRQAAGECFVGAADIQNDMQGLTRSTSDCGPLTVAFGWSIVGRPGFVTDRRFAAADDLDRQGGALEFSRGRG